MIMIIIELKNINIFKYYKNIIYLIIIKVYRLLLIRINCYFLE